MKPKSRSELQQAASNVFQDLEKQYRMCEMVYIVSELTKTMSLAMLQRELYEGKAWGAGSARDLQNVQGSRSIHRRRRVRWQVDPAILL